MIIVYLVLTASTHLNHIAPSLGRQIFGNWSRTVAAFFVGVLGEYHVRSY